MLRHVALGLLATSLLLPGCGPDKPRCSGPHPDFNVVVKYANRPLPTDTVVHVTYGGSGIEDYNLAAPGIHEVVFCQVADADGTPLDASAPLDGAAGQGNDEPVRALACALWTGGYAKVEVRVGGIVVTTVGLAPEENVCTGSAEILLDAPDAG